jgi:hypothetical protein
MLLNNNMIIIPLGIQCSVPDAIKNANLRQETYMFDWLWTPSKTVFNILSILLHQNIDKTIDYMTTDYKYYTYLGNERYVINHNHITECQMNKNTGLGITHYIINDEFKAKLRRRLNRFLDKLKSNEKILFIYADCASPSKNYYIDDINFGIDASNDLHNIYNLLSHFNKNIEIIYFCWNEHYKNDSIIKHISFDYKNHWSDVSELIKNYLLCKN